MQQQFFKIVNDFQHSFMDSTKRFAELNQRSIESLLHTQQQAVANCYAASQKNVQLLTQAKDPGAMMVIQSEIIRECAQSMVNSYHESTAMMDKARNEWIELLEDSAQQSRHSFKKVTDLAAGA